MPKLFETIEKLLKSDEWEAFKEQNKHELTDFEIEGLWYWLMCRLRKNASREAIIYELLTAIEEVKNKFD